MTPIWPIATNYGQGVNLYKLMLWFHPLSWFFTILLFTLWGGCVKIISFVFIWGYQNIFWPCIACFFSQFLTAWHHRHKQIPAVFSSTSILCSKVCIRVQSTWSSSNFSPIRTFIHFWRPPIRILFHWLGPRSVGQDFLTAQQETNFMNMNLLPGEQNQLNIKIVFTELWNSAQKSGYFLWLVINLYICSIRIYFSPLRQKFGCSQATITLAAPPGSELYESVTPGDHSPHSSR